MEESCKPPKFLNLRAIYVNPVRIAHVSPVIYPVPPVTYGGTERVIADLANAQRAAGHEVSLFAPRDSDLPTIATIGEYHSLSWRQDRTEQALPAGFPAELEAQQISDLVSHLRQFDVVHLHGSAHASGVCAALGIPTFRTIHWRADEADHSQHFEAFPNERVIAISHSQAGDVPHARLAGVVHHGLPLDRYSLESSDRTYLAFIGRMTDQKRPDRAIRMAERVGLPVHLAGPIDPGNPGYFDEAVRPALNDRTIYCGSLTDADKQMLFSHALALVFPIDWPEPFGLVMIEAMACGTPVIAWEKGSVSEIVEDGVTGIIVQSTDEAVTRIDEIKRLDPQIIRARFEARFSADRMAREVTSLYQNENPYRSSSVSGARSPTPYK